MIKIQVYSRVNWPGCIYRVYRFPMSDLSSQHSRVSKLDHWWVWEQSFEKWVLIAGSVDRTWRRANSCPLMYVCATGVVDDISLIGQIIYKIICYFAKELTLVWIQTVGSYRDMVSHAILLMYGKKMHWLYLYFCQLTHKFTLPCFPSQKNQWDFFAIMQETTYVGNTSLWYSQIL